MSRVAMLIALLAAQEGLYTVVDGQGANSFTSRQRGDSRLLAQAPSSSVRDSIVAGGQAVMNPMGRKLLGSVSGQPVGVCTNCVGRKPKEEDGGRGDGDGRKLLGATTSVETPTVLQSTKPNAQGRKLSDYPNAYPGEGGVVRTAGRKLSDYPNAYPGEGGVVRTAGRKLSYYRNAYPGEGGVVRTAGRKLSDYPTAYPGEGGVVRMGRKLQSATVGVETPTVLQSTDAHAQGRKLQQGCPNAYCGEGGVVRTGRKLHGATTGVETPTVLQSTEPNAQGRKLRQFFEPAPAHGPHGGATQTSAASGRRLLHALAEDLHNIVAAFA